MARLLLALVCALGVLLLAPQAAVGGGWWSYIDLKRTTVAPGQRVEVDEAVAFDSASAAEEAREPGRFHVYLLRGFDYAVVERAMREPSPRDWWSLGDAEAIQVGQVAVSVSDTNLGRARATFSVPDVPAATYHVMLCDAACAEPLADVIPAEGFTVVADPATARIALRVERLEQRLRNQAGRLAAARAEAERARVTARRARVDVEQLEERVASAAGQGRGRRPALVDRWAYAGWLVAVALAGILGLLVRRRRLSAAAPRPGPRVATGPAAPRGAPARPPRAGGAPLP
jgi:hypothetical protein